MQNFPRFICNYNYPGDSSYHFPREEIIIYFTLKRKRIWFYQDCGHGKTNMGKDEWKKSSIFAVEFNILPNHSKIKHLYNIHIIEVQILDYNCILKTKAHKGPVSSNFRLQLHAKDQGSKGAY